jgi:hypothetical protein
MAVDAIAAQSKGIARIVLPAGFFVRYIRFFICPNSN